MALNFAGGGLFVTADDIGRRPSKEIFYSIPGSSFVATNPDTADVLIVAGKLDASVDLTAQIFFAPLILPHRATITNGIVYGDAGLDGRTWAILRIELSDGTTDTLFSGTVNTAGVTIQSFSEVDNEKFAYIIEVLGIDTDDTLYGGVVTYTI